MPQSTIYRRPPDEQRVDPPNFQTRSNESRIFAQNERLAQQYPLGHDRTSGGPTGRVPQGDTHSSALGLNRQQSEWVSAPFDAAAKRAEARAGSAGGGAGPFAAAVTSALDYAQGAVQGGGRVIAGGLDQLARGASTQDVPFYRRTSQAPGSATQTTNPAGQQVPNSPVMPYWWEQGGTARGTGQASPTSALAGPPAPRHFTVEGVQGSATHFPGSGDNEAARRGLSERIAQRTQESMQGHMNALERERFSQNQNRFGATSDPMAARLGAIDQRRQALQQQIDRGLNTGARGQRLTVGGLNALRGQMESLDRTEASLIGSMISGQNSAGSDAASIQRQILANQGALANTSLAGQNQLAGIQARIQDPTNQARGQMIQAELGRMGINVQMPEMPDTTNMDRNQAALANQRYLQEWDAANAGMEMLFMMGGDIDATFQSVMEDIEATEDPAEIQRLRSIAFMLSRWSAGQAHRSQQGAVQGYAEGGLVGMGDPGMGGAEMTGMGADPASIQQYQQYVQMARQMNIEPVGFDEFSALMAQSQAPTQPPMPEMQQGAMASQNVIGMAEGGMVPGMSAIGNMGPQVDGQMVMDSDPNAPTDSIPAMIDGQQPAALDSGEFVMPADVVMHFGTDKLKKMIEAARAGSATGAQRG